MGCNEFQPALSDLVDGALPRDARAQLEAHLETCADCRALVADLKRVKAAARALPKMTAPESVWRNVRARLWTPRTVTLAAPATRRRSSRSPHGGGGALTGLAPRPPSSSRVTAGAYFMTRPATPRRRPRRATVSARKRLGRRPIG